MSTCHLTEVLRHGSIFAPARAWIEARSLFWLDLIGCGFCFSHWAAAISMSLLVGHNMLSFLGWSTDPFLLILVWLTATRGANLLNDLTKAKSLTPSRGNLDLSSLDDLEEDLDDGRTIPNDGSSPDSIKYT